MNICVILYRMQVSRSKKIARRILWNCLHADIYNFVDCNFQFPRNITVRDNHGYIETLRNNDRLGKTQKKCVQRFSTFTVVRSTITKNYLTRRNTISTFSL